MSCRMLAIAPRIWPLVDDGSLRFVHWISQLRQYDIVPTVLTPRWHPHWPAEFVCREVPVHRLLPAPKTPWSQSHYLRSLSKWLTKHREDYELVYVDDPFGSLHVAAQGKAIKGTPLVGRFHCAGIAANGMYDAATSLQNASEACKKLSAVVVPDADSDRRLRSAGVDPSRIIRIEDPAWVHIKQEPVMRKLAAGALGKINSDLMLHPDQKLIVVFGEISKRAGIDLFAKSIGTHLDAGKPLVAWLIGEGGYKRPFYESLRDRSWHRDILLQGSFDSIEELLQLADLCIFPGEATSTQFYAQAIVSSGIPWFAAQSSDMRAIAGPNSSRLLFSSGDASALTQLIGDWLRDETQFQPAWQAARDHFQKHFSIDHALRSWSELIHRLAAT